MFGTTKYEKRFSQLTMKALQAFKGMSTKEAVAADVPLSGVMRAAEREAIGVILSGLTAAMPDLNALDDPKAKREAFEEIFDVAKRAIFRVLDVSEVKSGKASWFAYAVKGIDEPPSPGAQLSPSWRKHFGLDDDADQKSLDNSNVPIWLRNRS